MDSMMDSSSAAHSITLDPTDSLSFALALGSSPQVALVISNPNSVENVAFKLRTKRPTRFIVRPNQGVIGPNSSATVLVILQQKDCDELLRVDESERQLSNDKFLVQSVGVDAEFCDLLTKKSVNEVMDDLTTLWANAEKETISNKKLWCRFELAPGASMTWHHALPPTMVVQNGDDKKFVFKDGSSCAIPPAKHRSCEVM